MLLPVKGVEGNLREKGWYNRSSCPQPPSDLKAYWARRNRVYGSSRALLECGTVSEAARVASGGPPQRIQDDDRQIADFKEAVSKARDVGIEALKDKAYTRASGQGLTCC